MVRGARSWVLVGALAAACALSSAVLGGGPRVALPADVPADVPLPEGAVLTAARDMADGSLSLVFETEQTPAPVRARLRERLEGAGWRRLSEAAVGDAVFWSYGKGARSVALAISIAEGKTVVGVTCWRPEPAEGGGRG